MLHVGGYMVAQRFEPEPPAVFCYHPQRWKMVVAALVGMSAAAWLGLPALRAVRTTTERDPRALSPLAVAIACLVFGLSALATVAVDLPRL
jgi:hypothetical protein